MVSICSFKSFSIKPDVQSLSSLCPLCPGEKYEQAIECTKTFLLFHPGDEVMNQNLAYYSAVLGEDKAKDIVARQVRLTPLRLPEAFDAKRLASAFKKKSIMTGSKSDHTTCDERKISTQGYKRGIQRKALIVI